MTNQADQADVEHVMSLERELQSTACRTNPARLGELLAPDFEEVGASGRLWELETILEQLATETPDDAEIEVLNLTGRAVADGLVLLRWDSSRAGRRARRVSLWRRDDAGWRLVHHQGTPLTPA